MELRERIAPRRISKQQAAKFMESFDLRNHLHNPHVRISFQQIGVPDAEDFANDLDILLKVVGYTVEVQEPMVKGDMPRGIQLIFGANRAAEARAIAHSLGLAGIQKPPFDAVQTETPDQLTVFVGSKLPN